MKPRRVICQSSIASLLLALSAAIPSHAAGPLNWDPAKDGSGSGGAGSWNIDPLNTVWFDGTTDLAWPNTTGDIAVFGGTGGTVTINSGTGVTAGGLTFNSGGYTIAGATAADKLTLGGTTPTIKVTNAGQTAIISTILAGTSGLNVSGLGGLTLTNTGNTFTGAITVDGGATLSYTGQGNADPTALGAGAKTITLTNGGILQPVTASSDPTAGSGKQVVIGSTGGVIDTPSGIQLLLNDANQFQGSGTLTKTGAGQLVLGQASTGYAATRTGNTVINGGAIYVGHANGLGVATSTVTVNAGGAIGSNTGITIANPITVAEAGNASGPGQLITQGGNTLFGGTLTLNAATVANVADYNNGGATSATNRIIFTSGIVTGAGDLIVNGPTGATRGVLTMNNTGDNLTGSIVINKGVSVENLARFNSAGVATTTGKTLGTAKIVFGAGGTSTATPNLDLRDNGNGGIGTVYAYGNNVDATANGGNITTSAGTFSGAGSINGRFQLGTLALGAQTLTTTGSQGNALEFVGATTLSGDATISPASTGTSSTSDLTLSGAVGGGFSLTKTGAGILTLSGVNTFGGAGKTISITGGTLAVSADSGLGNVQNAVTVTGAALRATGSFTTARTISITGTPTGTGANGNIDVAAASTLTLSTAIASPTATFGKIGAGTLASTVTSGTPFGAGNITVSSGTLSIQPSGSGADVVLTGANSGAISRITTTAGTGYSGAPTAAFSGPGTGAAGAPTVTGTSPNQTVNGFTITNTGSGYTTVPTITLSGGGAGTGATATVTALNQFTYDKNAGLRLDKGSNTSVTFTVGVTASPANSVLNRAAGGSTLTLIPSALANLGVTEKFIVNGGVNSTNSTVSPSIVAVASPTDSTATFLSYDAANGFTPATYAAASDINDAAVTSATNFSAAGNTSLTANRSVNAVRVGTGATVSGAAGTALTLGAVINPSFTGSQAGIILNGGSLTVPTITPSGNAETIIYTSAAGGSISSTISGSGATAKFGPGTLNLSGALPTGTFHINDGTVATGAVNVINGQAVQLNTSGATLDLHGFDQTVGNLTVSVPAGNFPVVTTNGGAATLTLNPTSGISFSGLLTDGTGGGVLSIVKTGGNTETFNTPQSYTGGTTINNGTLVVANTATLGSGNVAITGPGKLQIDTVGAINTGATISLAQNVGTVSQPVLILRGPFQPNIAAGSNGIIALDSTGGNFNLPNLLTGSSLFLGANNGATYSGGSLAVGLGNSYRLGGGGNTLTFTSANVVTGANALVVGVPQILGGVAPTNGSGGVTFNSAQNFSGTTTVNAGSTLTLIGQNVTNGTGGSALNSTAFNVNYGTLVLNSDVGTNTANGRSGNRLADAAPVTLNQGTLRLTVANVTAAGGTTSETIGALNFSKGSTISFTRGGGAENGSLTAASISTRSLGDTLSITTNAANELGATTAPGAKFTITSGAPAATNGMVAPYFVNATDNSFVTYGGNGFANATYSSTNLETSAATDIVDQTTAVALNANRNAYALRLGTGALTGNSVTIGSGGLILNNAATGVTHSSNLVFGNGAPAEAVIFGNNSSQAVLTGLITANAITKFGTGSVRLSNVGNSTNAGLANAVITVNNGNFEVGDRSSVFNNANRLPDSVSLVMNGGTASFFADQTLSGLSGTGGTVQVGTNSSSGGTAHMLTINTQVDQAFAGTFTSDDGGGGDNQITKGGAGKLTLTGTTQINRTVASNYGEFVFGGNATINLAGSDRQRVLVGQGGTFTLDNTAINNNDRVILNSGTTNGGGYLVLTGGTFNYLGNANATSSETFGTSAVLAANNDPAFNTGNDVINIVPGAGQAAILTSERTIVRNAGASVVFRGTNLGGARGASDVATFAYNTTSPALTGAGAQGSNTVGVIKGVIADSVISNVDTYGLATYDNGANGVLGGGDDIGIRRLAASEMASTFADGNASLVNVRASSAIAGIDTAATINALHIGSGGNITGNGTLTVNSGTILAADNGVAGTNTINVANLAFTGNEAIIHTASDLTIGSALTGTLALTKGGSATLALTNPFNGFTGAINVNGGLLSIDTSSELGAASNTVNLNNGGGLQFTSTVPLSDGGTVKRNVLLGAAGGRVDVTAGNSATIPGVISGGLGTINAGISATTGARADSTTVFTKTGTGTLVLTGTNTFSGRAEVNGGTLLVGDSSGAGSLGANAFVAVNNGGTLGGSGTISGGVTVTSGGTLQPGNSPGKLNTGNVTFSGGTFSLEVFGTTAAFDYDQLNVTGTVTLASNSPLVLSLGAYDPVDNGSLSFTIINNDGTDPVSGTGRFTAGSQVLNEGSIFSSGGQLWSLSYAGGTGNDVVLTAVPEPGTMASLAGGVALLSTLRRFRRRRA